MAMLALVLTFSAFSLPPAAQPTPGIQSSAPSLFFAPASLPFDAERLDTLPDAGIRQRCMALLDAVESSVQASERQNGEPAPYSVEVLPNLWETTSSQKLVLRAEGKQPIEIMNRWRGVTSINQEDLDLYLEAGKPSSVTVRVDENKIRILYWDAKESGWRETEWIRPKGIAYSELPFEPAWDWKPIPEKPTIPPALNLPDAVRSQVDELCGLASMAARLAESMQTQAVYRHFDGKTGYVGFLPGW
jgi:hypothetical protein